MEPDKAGVLPEAEPRGDAPAPLPEKDGKLSREQACAYIQGRWGLTYAVYTLAAYAARGTGPEYSKAGPRAVYTRAALDQWAQSKLTGPSRKASDLKPIMES